MTNAYTESLNNLIRVMNRLGRGYSFEALRAKILFSEGAHKISTPRRKFERQSRDVFGDEMPMFRMERSFDSIKPKNYGSEISTLIRMIENEQL